MMDLPSIVIFVMLPLRVSKTVATVVTSIVSVITLGGTSSVSTQGRFGHIQALHGALVNVAFVPSLF